VSASGQLPLVSVITPAYNRAAYLQETIASVLSQDYPKLEYLVLDDGSTDNTRDVAAQYFGRITFSSHPNMGETRTVNKGFAMARGAIVGVVNSDDPLLPGAVAQIVDTMIREPEVIVAYPDWDWIDSKGNRIGHRRTFEYDYVNMVRWFHCVPGPGAFFRQSVVKELGGRDEQFRYVADFDFWLRAGLLGPFKRVPKTLATFRVHGDSASSKGQGRPMAEEHIRLANKFFSLPNLPPEVAAVRREALGSAYYTAGLNLGDSSPQLKRRYFMQALVSAPTKYFFEEYRERLVGPIGSTVLGAYVGFVLRKVAGLFPSKKALRCPH
jgi:glycosyltransferase involved in cell wall biosynthesis